MIGTACAHGNQQPITPPPTCGHEMLGYPTWPPEEAPLWLLQKQVGKGAFSTVYSALDATSGKVAAVKDASNMYLVTEMCQGLQLAEWLQQCSFFPEQYAAWVIRQVACALVPLHSSGLVHCDIKPENLMYEHDSPGSTLKAGVRRFSLSWMQQVAVVMGHSCSTVQVIDFGFAMIMPPDVGSSITCPELVGSEHFVAPEVLKRQEYSPACDNWSLGVLCYMLLCGNVPFSSELQTRMAPLRFYEDVWHVISADAKDVIKRLLCKDPVARLTAAQVNVIIRRPVGPNTCWQQSYQSIIVLDYGCGSSQHHVVGTARGVDDFILQHFAHVFMAVLAGCISLSRTSHNIHTDFGAANNVSYCPINHISLHIYTICPATILVLAVLLVRAVASSVIWVIMT
eukprot:jgi/Chrzof1/12520/Cz06g37060.t1